MLRRRNSYRKLMIRALLAVLISITAFIGIKSYSNMKFELRQSHKQVEVLKNTNRKVSEQYIKGWKEANRIKELKAKIQDAFDGKCKILVNQQIYPHQEIHDNHVRLGKTVIMKKDTYYVDIEYISKIYSDLTKAKIDVTKDKVTITLDDNYILEVYENENNSRVDTPDYVFGETEFDQDFIQGYEKGIMDKVRDKFKGLITDTNSKLNKESHKNLVQYVNDELGGILEKFDIKLEVR